MDSIRDLLTFQPSISCMYMQIGRISPKTTNISEKENYLKGLQKYHKLLEQVLFEEYNISTDYLEVLGWGFTTTAFYIKSKNNAYLVRLSNYSKEKLESVNKEITLSNYFNAQIPTSKYLKNRSGEYTSMYEDRIFRVSEYIEGLSPFDIDMDIFKQMIGVLKIIHNFEIPSITLPKKPYENKPLRFLHGDLTPSNILISYGKIVGVLDFEMGLLGPVERDLAKTTLFGWYRMPGSTFENVLTSALGFYNYKEADIKLIMKYILEYAEEFLDNIISHKKIYNHKEDWVHDFDFAKGKISELALLSI